MIPKLKRKLTRSIKRLLKNNKSLTLVLITFVLVTSIAYNGYMQNRRLTVNPASYASLLNVIASVESKDNYNAYFSNSGNTKINFTAMSIREVMDWQAEFVRKGSPSNAVGKYQIISPTLTGLVEEMGIDPGQRFDPLTQDRMAIALIERRGAESYINNELTKEQFAANLAKEWASLPRVIGDNPDKSYYESDGLNKSLVNVDEVMAAIDGIRSN